MSDAELIARLRYEANTDGYDYHGDLHEKAADRIEELEAKLAQMQRTLDWTEERAKAYRDGREMMGHMWAKAEEARRKAIEGMERAVFLWEQPHYGDNDTIIDHGSEAIDTLRTILAEIKGEKP
jgi:hypothetical protein